MKKIINTTTNEVIAEYLANHSMTLEEAIEICGGEIISNMNDPRWRDDNVFLNGKWYYYEELDIISGDIEEEKY